MYGTEFARKQKRMWLNIWMWFPAKTKESERKKFGGTNSVSKHRLPRCSGPETAAKRKGGLEPRPGRGPFAQYSWELLLAAQETVDDGEALSGYANILVWK